jgi:hypothetical protein
LIISDEVQFDLSLLLTNKISNTGAMNNQCRFMISLYTVQFCFDKPAFAIIKPHFFEETLHHHRVERAYG